MSSFTHRLAGLPLARSLAIVALMGTAALSAPLNSARAADSPAVAAATSTKAESVEDRITSLHAALKITPDEEKNWDKVAATMRENASKMEKLAADKTATAPGAMSAVDDLKTYEKFAHAHYEGLKDLISSFETLYKAMPADQQKLADNVFQTFGHGPAVAHN
jgi:hypothetical protein